MKFYFDASNALDQLLAKKEGSVKAFLSQLPDGNRKRVAALVIETLKYKTVLLEVIQAAGLMAAEKKIITSQSLALVLVHDQLFTGGIQASSGPLKQAVLRHKTRLASELTRLKIRRGATSNLDLMETDERASEDETKVMFAKFLRVYVDAIPRYVRINTVKWSLPEAKAYFIMKGFQEADPFTSNKAFQIDEHVPNLMRFSPLSKLTEDANYESGKLILQDKASCFPSVVLNPDASDDCHVIDATAAPGNKTTHLAAIMDSKGTLMAFEKDNRRFETLKKMVARAGCTKTVLKNNDFLACKPDDSEDLRRATHIMLDPSCSGSGIVNRLDYLTRNPNDAEEINESQDHERLVKLATFQTMMVKHAMKFPNAKRITYSTCSVHAIENEHVVKQVLSSEEARSNGWHLAPKDQALPSWHRRGIQSELGSEYDAESLVRCKPGEDGTNGFFVALFVRNEPVSSAKRPGSDLESPPPKKKQKKKKKKSTSGGTEIL